jgi:hypothetical protein
MMLTIGIISVLGAIGRNKQGDALPSAICL